ncbi:MAG TPA: transcriptional regulator PpsR [Paracoccaceae bacterium]|nr:transcriptional regulator PpsR [Paracoccaceae bacterium]
MSSNRKPGDAAPLADGKTVRSLLAGASDLALAVDAEGVVVHVETGGEDFSGARPEEWIGRRLADCVTPESRTKLESLLNEARSGDRPRRRELNHPTAEGEDLPIRYAAAYAPDEDLVLLMGRDQRAIASLQSRLVAAQQAMEQEYERLRQMETRYRILFQTATEAFLIVDAASNRVSEANPAAAKLLGVEATELTGRPLQDRIAPEARQALTAALASAVASGRSESVEISDPGETRRIDLRATLFRAAADTLLLCVLRPRGETGGEDQELEAQVMRLLRRSTDGVVLSDTEGRILWANDAFLGLAEVALEDQLRGESLDRFLGRPGVDLNVMLQNAQEHGRLRHFSTTLRGAYGSTAQVEISTAHLPAEVRPGFGFIIRDVTRSTSAQRRGSGPVSDPQSVDHMVELVGSVPLRELVRATTDEIERMCIQTALRLTGGNRASAAEMLGLSRQSLYVKLRRFGLVDSDADD